jgi:hypothetical protein
LHPAQALEAIRTFAFPRLPFHLRSARLAQGIAADADASVRRVMRERLRLPQDSSKGYLHGDFRAGGLGLPCVEEEVAVQALAQAAKLLQSRDSRVRQASAGDLETCVQRANGGRICNDKEVAAWLSGDGPNLGSGGGVWRQARAAAGCAALAELKPHFVGTDGSVGGVRLCWLGSKEGGEEAADVIRGLHAACRRAATSAWSKCIDQGRFMADFSSTPEGARALSAAALMPEASWVFSARARSNCVPVKTRAKRATAAEQSCRRCGSYRETLSHVIGCCPANMPWVKARHDRVLGALAEELRRAGIHHLVDKKVASCVTSDLRLLRPDLQLKTASGEELLVDVKSPVEGKGKLDSVASQNVKHYDALRQQVSQTTGRTCHVLTFVVGALGAWWRGNWATLRECGLGRAAARRLAKKCCRSAPTDSFRLWLAHCDGNSGGGDVTT